MLSQFNPNHRHYAAQRLLDNGCLGVAQDDVALAFIISGGFLPDLRNFEIGDEVPDFALHHIQSVYSPHASTALAAQICRANR